MRVQVTTTSTRVPQPARSHHESAPSGQLHRSRSSSSLPAETGVRHLAHSGTGSGLKFRPPAFLTLLCSLEANNLPQPTRLLQRAVETTCWWSTLLMLRSSKMAAPPLRS